MLLPFWNKSSSRYGSCCVGGGELVDSIRFLHFDITMLIEFLRWNKMTKRWHGFKQKIKFFQSSEISFYRKFDSGTLIFITETLLLLEPTRFGLKSFLVLSAILSSARTWPVFFSCFWSSKKLSFTKEVSKTSKDLSALYGSVSQPDKIPKCVFWFRTLKVIGEGGFVYFSHKLIISFIPKFLSGLKFISRICQAIDKNAFF